MNLYPHFTLEKILRLDRLVEGSCLCYTHSNTFPSVMLCHFLTPHIPWWFYISHLVLNWRIRWQTWVTGMNIFSPSTGESGMWNFFLKFNFKYRAVLVVMLSSHTFCRWFCYFWRKGKWNKWGCFSSPEIHLAQWSWHTLLQCSGPLCNLQWMLNSCSGFRGQLLLS